MYLWKFSPKKPYMAILKLKTYKIENGKIKNALGRVWIDILWFTASNCATEDDSLQSHTW